MPSWLERPAIILLAALLAGAVVALVIERRDGTSGALEIALADATPAPGGPIEVYVTGAVSQPGLYQLEAGTRAADALAAAGGPAPDADLESVNLAVRLHDEDRVLVPHLGQAATSSAGTTVVPGASVVNINTASAGELDALPGIGEVYSQRIVQSRAADGPFAAPEDLLVRGVIPRATFEKIQTLITIGP